MLMLAFEEYCTAQIVLLILMRLLMEKSTFPQQHGNVAPSLFKESQQYPIAAYGKNTLER